MSKKMCYNFYNMKTYAMMVLGCKVNDYEAAFVEQELNKDSVKVLKLKKIILKQKKKY